MGGNMAKGNKRTIVVDGRGHLMGRLAATLAKKLLEGYSIVVVRCEEICISGPIYRMRIAFFMRKRTNTNPKKGPFHYRQPSLMFWRVLRGMIPHKTPRGADALSRLRTYDGVPPPYDTVTSVVVPSALRVIRLRPDRKFTVLKDLAQIFGWKHAAVLEKLEDKRKVRSYASYVARKAKTAERTKAKKAALAEPSLKGDNEMLAKYGY